MLNGHIYRGRKPVHWSPSSQTALAEAELEYPEGHVSPSIYVAMPIERTGERLLHLLCPTTASPWLAQSWGHPGVQMICIHEATPIQGPCEQLSAPAVYRKLTLLGLRQSLSNLQAQPFCIRVTIPI